MLFGLLAACLVGSCFTCEAAIAASHSHRLSKERIEDGFGSFSPRTHDRNGNGNGDHSTGFDHEAILGSRKEAEEFDNLSPEESKKRLLILVGKMDLDKDGSIERQELKAWIIRSFHMLSEEESKERFQEVDENEDGLVTWQEYIQETFGLTDENLAIPLHDLEEQRVSIEVKLNIINYFLTFVICR